MTTRTAAHRAADKRYAPKVKPVTVKLNLTKSDDIAIDRHLDAVGDKTAYIKKLIKDDMKLSQIDSTIYRIPDIQLTHQDAIQRYQRGKKP